MPDPQVTVNGRSRPLAGVPAHTNALDFLRGLGLTGAKEGCAEGECGACAVLVAARPPGPEPVDRGQRLPGAGRSRSTARRSSPPRGSARPSDLHPVQAGARRARRVAVRLLHAGVRLLDGRRVLPPGPRGDGPRPARDRAATCAAAPATARSATPPRPSAPRRTATSLARRQDRPAPAAGRDPARRLRPSRRPRRGARGCSREHPDADRRRRRPPTGASRSTCAAAARRTSSRSTGCPSCGSVSTDGHGRDRRRADPQRGRGGARRRRAAARRRSGRSSPRR